MRHWLGRICNGLRWTSALLCLITSTHLPAAEIDAPQVFLDGIHYQVTAELDEASDQPVYLRIGQQQYDSDQMGQTRVFSDVVLSDRGNVTLELIATDQVLAAAEVPVIPAWISILPPLVAIGMALLLRSVLPALMLGIWLGAWGMEGLTIIGFFCGAFRRFEG